MSLDLYMILPPCPTCGHESEEIYFNCTYNLAPMWYKIYPEDQDFVAIDGMTGREALPKIMTARVMLEELEEDFEKLNPSNGWGTRESFLVFLGKVMQACIDHPELIWEADR